MWLARSVVRAGLGEVGRLGMEWNVRSSNEYYHYGSKLLPVLCQGIFMAEMLETKNNCGSRE